MRYLYRSKFCSRFSNVFIMKIFSLVSAGITGTACMTLFTQLAFYILKTQYHVVRILASMLIIKKPATLDSRPSFASYAVATVIHYAIGVLFVFGYHWLTIRSILETTFSHGVLFGTVIGTVGIVGWTIFFAVHPDPPPVRLPTYLSVIWVGHIILSLVMFYVLRFFDEASQASIPICYIIVM